MTKTNFIDKFSETFKTTKKLAAEVYKWIGEDIKEHLTCRDIQEYSLFGLGKLVVKERASRVGRNPKTGVVVPIPKTSSVKFKPSKDLKSTNFN